MSLAALFTLALFTSGLVALAVVIAIRRGLIAKSAEITALNRRLQSTFDQVIVGVVHLDAEGRWIRFNTRFCDITGYRRDELIGLTIDDLTHPLDRDWDAADRNAMVHGESDRSAAEKRYVRKDGRIIWVRVTRSTIHDAGGQPEFFIAIVEEITTRKENETQLISASAKYRAIFDSAVEAMAVIDAAGSIQSVNASVERVFGYGSEELVGGNIRLLMSDDMARLHDAYLKRYGETGEKAIIGIGREVVGRRKDGSLFPLDLSVAEWKQDGETFFTGVMRDVSARKSTETALRVSEENLRILQDEFAHLARVNDLGEMAAAIAHEINQPLTAIVNYLNHGIFIAAEGFHEESFAESVELMRQASGQALRAGEIVRRLREFIGQGNGVRVVETAEMLVDRALALALVDTRLHGITVSRIANAEEAKVEVDAVQIQQVLANLLRNAIEALRTPRSGAQAPLLTVSTNTLPDGSIEFAVADNGPGVEPALLDRLFEPFFTTKPSGMGMGLSLCRRLIQAHGGQIEAVSSAGSGATFSFTLPAANSSWS